MTSTRRQKSSPPNPARPKPAGRDPLEWRLRLALAVAVTLAFAAGMSPPSNWLWGMNLLRYYPKAFGFALWALTLAAIAFLPAWPKGATADAAHAGRPVKPWLVALLALVGGVALFNLGHTHSYLLGDGYEVLRRLRQGGTAAPRAPLFNFLAPISFRLFDGFEPGRDREAAGQLGILVGALSCAGAAWFLARIARRDAGAALAAGGLLIVTPALQLFCGYVESYPPLLGATLLFLAAGFHRTTGGGPGSLGVAFMAQVLALLAHPFGISLVPATLLLLAWRPGAGRLALDRRRIAQGLGGCVALAGSLWILFELNPGLHATNKAFRYLAPQEFLDLLFRVVRGLFRPHAWAGSYRLNSLVHVTEVWNTAWLVGAAGLAWVIALLTHRAGRRALTAAPALLALATLPIIFLIRALLRTPLGSVRDWDLFSNLGVSIAAVAAGTALGGAGRRLAGPALAAGLFFTIPWIGIQMSDERAATRHFDCLDAEPRPEPFVASGFHGVMGDRFGDLRQFDMAERAYLRSLQAYPRYEYAWRLGIVEMSGRRYDRAAQALNRALELRPDDRESMTELGSALNGLGQYAQADSVLARVIALYPDNAGAAMIYRARARFLLDDSAGGRHWLDEARRTMRPDDIAWKDARALEEELKAAVAAGAVPSPPAAAPGGTPPTPR